MAPPIDRRGGAVHFWFLPTRLVHVTLAPGIQPMDAPKHFAWSASTSINFPPRVSANILKNPVIELIPAFRRTFYSISASAFPAFFASFRFSQITCVLV